ncbi:MAG: aminopeptidase N [Candidatus Paceibacterota bacterium]|jgi:aminopeptidase N
METSRKWHELDKQYPEAEYLTEGIVRLIFTLDATEDGKTEVSAKYSVRRNIGTPKNAPLVLDLASEVNILSVTINGKKLLPSEYERTGEAIIIPNVPDGVFKVAAKVLIDPKNNGTGEGMYAAGDMLLTQNEPEGLRKIFPYFDCPKVMAPFRTTIIGNKEKYPVMLSNGNLFDYHEKIGLTNGNRIHWITYDLPFAIPSYLFALVAGKLEVLKSTYATKSGRTINLEIYAEAKDIEKCHHAMESLKHAMAYDEEWYGYECDVDDYKIVATPYFNMGAMENKGLNIFNVSCVLASPETATDENYERVEGVIGHEYFHNYTGDKITNKDWRELGTKESITVRRDSLFSSDYRGWGLRKEISNALDMRARQFAEDASPRRHAIRPAEIKEPNNMYTMTVYEKGAEVYKTMEGIIGREGFLNGMKLYAKRHDGQATRIEDLIRCMEDANGVDLHQFRNWFTQSGTPTVSIVSEYDAKKKVLKLHIKQSCTMAPDRTEMEPFDIPFAIGLIGPSAVGEMAARTLRINKWEQTFEFDDIPFKPALSLNRNFAPVNVKYDYWDGELALLMARDNSLFARWDASQTYGAQVLLKLVEDVKAGRELVLDKAYSDAFGAVLRGAILCREGIDKNLLAEMMSLPGETTLANMSETVDPHAIHTARKFAYRELAKKYYLDFERLQKENCSDFDWEISFDPLSVAKRSVANTALGYLATCNNLFGANVFRQFDFSLGMSDKYTALSILVNGKNKPFFDEYADKALRMFYDQFKDDNNTVDKWFAVQAYSNEDGAIARVKELATHPAFDWNNPNRVRSLFGAFAYGSLQFHTGEGYRLFADFLAEYAPKNDIVASRMVEPLTDWKRYVPELQSLMKAELLRLKEELSKTDPAKVRGTMEKIEKSLAQ